MDHYTEEKEIDLSRLVRALLSKLWVIIICTILGAGAGFGYAAYMITPLYSAEALMYVNNSAINVGNTSISMSDLTAAKSLVDTYTVILKTRNTLEDVIKRNNLPYSYEELKDMIKSSPVNSTEVFGITVTTTDPAEAEKLANSIAKILPEKISDVVEGSSVKIVDYAVIPKGKTSPSIARYTVIGAMIGLLISAGWIVVKELLNDEVKEESDLNSAFPGIPVLASIPDLTDKKGKKYGKGKGE
ncbi:MAG: hypothetical protein HUJ55_06790 [Ileibacterium sp.]|nr:hypothetical protein [Ileibacterium sp.]